MLVEHTCTSWFVVSLQCAPSVVYSEPWSVTQVTQQVQGGYVRMRPRDLLCIGCLSWIILVGFEGSEFLRSLCLHKRILCNQMITTCQFKLIRKAFVEFYKLFGLSWWLLNNSINVSYSIDSWCWSLQCQFTTSPPASAIDYDIHDYSCPQ